jgi:hypothetical protein
MCSALGAVGAMAWMALLKAAGFPYSFYCRAVSKVDWTPPNHRADMCDKNKYLREYNFENLTNQPL